MFSERIEVRSKMIDLLLCNINLYQVGLKIMELVAVDMMNNIFRIILINNLLVKILPAWCFQMIVWFNIIYQQRLHLNLIVTQIADRNLKHKQEALNCFEVVRIVQIYLKTFEDY